MGGDFMYRNLATLTTLLFIFSSCSGHQFKRPESIEDKMSRFEDKTHNTNQVPKLEISSVGIEKFSSARTGRAPASVVEENTQDDKVGTSNKKLYFMSLYSQYERLRAYTPSGSTMDINVCPSFHTGLVEWRDTAKKMGSKVSSTQLGFKYDLKRLGDYNYISQYPELGLPLSDDSKGPNVASLMSSRPVEVAASEGSRLMSQALHQHTVRIFSELSELCDTGTSTNYYNFENLLTHARTHRDLTPSQYGLQVLMKTTIISNMVLIESIQNSSRPAGRAPASVDLYTDEVLERLGTPWAYDFLKKMISQRD